MSPSSSSLRTTLLGAVAVALVSTAGCGWVKSKFRTDSRYQESRESQPLEVPPGLDLPRNNATMQIPAATAATAAGVSTLPPGQGSVASVSDFTVADTLDSTWRRLGLALERTEGVAITSRAQLLNSYEVSYLGTTLLIRAEASSGQTRVSAVGTDGQPLSSGPATQLLGLLHVRLN